MYLDFLHTFEAIFQCKKLFSIGFPPNIFEVVYLYGIALW